MGRICSMFEAAQDTMTNAMTKPTSFAADIRPLFTDQDVQHMIKAFNLASYGPPNSLLESYPSPSFGQITSTNSSQRVMQVSMHYRF